MAPDTPQPFYSPVSGQASDEEVRQDPGSSPSQQSPSSQPPSTSPALGVAPARGPEKSAKTPHFSEDSSNHPLISQFTALYHSALANAKKGNEDKAKTDYTDMLKIYNQLAAMPEMHDMNKEIAHFCLQDVYDTVSRTGDPTVSRLSFGALIGITVILLIVGGMLASNPSIVGLVTGRSITGATNGAPAWVGGPQAITITGPTSIQMSPLFSAPNRGPLTYLATSSGTLDTVAAGEFVTLIPKYGWRGTTRITLIAARRDDPRAMTKVPVDVTVA